MKIQVIRTIANCLSTLFAILFLLIPTHIYAQQSKMSEMERLSLYYSNGQYSKCISVAEEILSEERNNYTYNESLIIGIGAISYSIEGETDKAKEMGEIARKGIEATIDIDSDIRKFQTLNNEEKKVFIENYIKEYELIVGLFTLFPGSTNIGARRIVEFFHNYIYLNRYLFDKNNLEEARLIVMILKGDFYYALYTGNYKQLLNRNVPELMSINTTEDYKLYKFIYSALEQYRQLITQIGFTENGKKYQIQRANYLLQLNELGLFINGHKQSKNFRSMEWTDIKKSLKSDECAVLMYDYTLLGVNLLGGIIITPLCTTPIDLSMHLSNISQESFLKSIKTDYPQLKKIYLCPIGEWEGKDIAYCDESVYQMFSLFDIERKAQKESYYNGGMISIYADINYGVGDKNDVPQLNEGKRVIAEAKSLFGDKVYSLTGNNVRKINFQNIIDDIDIFHVSTHGFIRQVDYTPKDTLEFYNAFMGNTAKSGYGLALSKYNEDKNHYYISAEDLKIIKFHGHGFVYLDACMTGSSASNFWGTYGLAKSFYLAGAANVVAYLKPINEKVAADFAIMFYQELYNSPIKNYHDIFYKVKNDIIKKYYSFLPKNKHGYPDIGIVLWE